MNIEIVILFITITHAVFQNINHYDIPNVVRNFCGPRFIFKTFISNITGEISKCSRYIDSLVKLLPFWASAGPNSSTTKMERINGYLVTLFNFRN